MKKSDVAYIKALLWGIAGLCQGAELSDSMFWIVMLNILLYAIEFIFYKCKENGK